MSDYALRIVRDFATAVDAAIHDDERPKLVEEGGRVQRAKEHLVSRPGNVDVFINPAHRMVILHGDEYRPDLCRKINESRYGPLYRHAPVMGSENSEDATTWTFVRSLEKRCRPEWITDFLRAATGIELQNARVNRILVRYWFGRVTDDKLPVPPGLNETATELDALIELQLNEDLHLVSIEAKVTSPFSGGDRDQFIRTIDVGSYYAATRNVPVERFWAVAILPETWRGAQDRNPHKIVAKYKGQVNALRNALAHRHAPPEGIGQLTDQQFGVLACHIGDVTWERLIEVAGNRSDDTRRNEFGPWP